jgi:hypothetical protein
MAKKYRKRPYRMSAELKGVLQQRVDGKPHSMRMGFDENCEHCHIVISFMDELMEAYNGSN